ncbi:adenosine 3'-phospho 5'-phosphosulfate transporter 2-like [Symsagittifera roscoffensis]|uniref:adenosine 3'-phospho 5'-phosphosulfate transporter 2-like n=1 Tax=Symsagittifera roscoffensis TaxID=84072 RepID=UPI00307BD292
MNGEFVRKIPTKIYFVSAFLLVVTMGCSNKSLKYLNYPTQVIFKRCKLIPAMIGGILLQKKTICHITGYATGARSDLVVDIKHRGHSRTLIGQQILNQENEPVIPMFLLCAGLVWFSLADSTVQPNFDVTGIIIISCTLTADAFIGNVGKKEKEPQELYMKKYSTGNTEIVFYSFLIGTVYILFTVLFKEPLWKPCQVALIKRPSLLDTHTLFKAFLFSLTGYCGVHLVLDLIVTYGALLAVTVTICRKAVSIIISFLVFAKLFTVHHVCAGGVTFFGIS